MSKFIKLITKNEMFSLSECSDGFWLYDYTLRMNISMRTKTEQDAVWEALSYYQRRFKEVTIEYNDLKSKVDTFVSQFEIENN